MPPPRPRARRAPSDPSARRSAPKPSASRPSTSQPSASESVAAALAEAARIVAEIGEEKGRMGAAIEMALSALKGGGQVLFCGNGGSASQAAHLAAELSGRFYYDRPPLRAIALTENTAALTAIANDYGYDVVFERQLEAIARPGDVLVALTTSGRSPNVRRAVACASRLGLKTIGLTGSRGRDFARRCDLAFVVPADDTARIQEVHLLLGHVLCAELESAMFPRSTIRIGRLRP
jgi:D-sedoheptulose 7-phosphate isomerase